jgi:hypothetical protein
VSCSVLQAGELAAWCAALPEIDGQPAPEAAMLPVAAAFAPADFLEESKAMLRLKVSLAGSRLESLGLWLMQIVATLAFVEVLVHRQIITPRILIGLFIVGFTYWFTVLEMRRKARADLGV